MKSTGSQFVHGADWQAAHDSLAANRTLFDSLKFDGIICDVEGQPREQRRCPSCFSTFSGPPISFKRALEVLREQSCKLDASIDQLLRASDHLGAEMKPLEGR